jgi:methionyl-tRNA synthetase
MSKSKGNVVDPIVLAAEYGLDPVRYFLLREVQFGQDGNFSLANFRQRYNTDLANDIGNLLNRSLTMCQKYFDGKIPEVTRTLTAEDQKLIELKDALPEKIDKALSKLQFSQALEFIWEIINKANKYIEVRAPWTLAKEGKTEELANVIYILLESQRICAKFVAPFMPDTAAKILAQLNCQGEKLKIGTIINKPEPLFPRLQ